MQGKAPEIVRQGTLILIKRPNSRNWYARGTLLGRAYFFSTKTDDLRRARSLAAAAQRKILASDNRPTFREACEAYAKDGGQGTYLQKLVARLGDVDLSDLHQKNLDDAAHAIYPNVSPATLNRCAYTPFIAVWNYAVGNEWAAARTWRRPRKPKGTGHRSGALRSGTRPVPYERAWQFLSAMSPAPAMIMTALFYTGMRPIELFSLQCADIDVDGRWLVVQSSKTGEPRGVPIHEMLVPLLTALKARGAEAAFLNRHGRPYPPTDDDTKGQLAGAISGARKRLRGIGTPIDDVSPYTGRHTVSTQLVIAGVHPHIKDQILGHAADDMSRHYTNVPQAPLIAAIANLPTIGAWRDAPWLNDPIAWQSKLNRWENYGRGGKPQEE